MEIPKFKILLVDDDNEVLDTLVELLSSTEFDIIRANYIPDAIKLVETHHRTLAMVVSDYKMHNDETGFELRRKLNENFKDIPFVIFSGFLTKELILTAVDLSIAAFLHKPIKIDEFYKVISEKSKDRVSSLSEDWEMQIEFQRDSLSLLEEIESSILSLEDDPENIDLINDIMRLLHTIKGTAACLGMNDVAAFAHKYEDFYQPFKLETRRIDSRTSEVMVEGYDTLKRLLEQVTAPIPETIDTSSTLESFSAATQEKAAESATKSTSSNRRTSKEEKKNSELYVSTDLLDDFMEQSGELTVLKSIIVKHVVSLENQLGQNEILEHLVTSLDEMHSISGQMQNKILELRKVPIKNVLRSLPRVLRDSKKATQKEVDLNIIDNGLMIDTNISNALPNMLVHIVRNSVDHGIEAPEERAQLGKPSTGIITIDCKECGENVVIDITDDGKGINTEVVRSKCLEKGLLTEEELSEMSEKAINEMIFAAGFSTAQEVSEISGRGVGMDMVRSTVQELRGSIDLNSTPSQGTHLQMTIPKPKSVLIVTALFVQAGQDTLAINQDDILRVLQIDEEKREQFLREINGAPFLNLFGNLIPLINLKKELRGADESETFDFPLNVVIVRQKDSFFGVAVDEILDNEEVVVKSISSELRKTGIYSGATFIGEGMIALILDMEGLAKRARLSSKLRKVQEQESSFEEVHNLNSSSYLAISTPDQKKVLLPTSWIHRLEEVKKTQVESYGANPILRYYGQVLPLYKIFSDDDNSEVNLSVVVLKVKDHYIGLVVPRIIDIINVVKPLNETIQEPGYIGIAEYEEQLLPVIDIPGILQKVPHFSLEAEAV